MWYVPASGGCDKGHTYLSVHEIKDSGVTQKHGFHLSAEPVTSAVIIGGKLVFVDSHGLTDLTSRGFTQKFGAGGAARNSAGTARRFSITSWTELP